MSINTTFVVSLLKLPPMSENYISSLASSSVELSGRPVLLYQENDYKVYWMGVPEENAFRTNVYLIVSGDECLIVDPGNRPYFPVLKKNIENLSLIDNVVGMILCHQDPDVAASMYDWLTLNPKLKVISSARTNVLLPHYGISEYDFYDIGESNNYKFKFKSGKELQFIDAPFLHFPGAFATYDPSSKFLFSGDVWAAIDIDYQFIVSNFDEHTIKLDLFHIDYMASNKASSGFAKKLIDYDIDIIVPQHGAIIPSQFVPDAIEYLNELQCGIDIIYPD